VDTVTIPGKIPPKDIEFIVERFSRGNPLFFKAPTVSKRAKALLNYLRYTKKEKKWQQNWQEQPVHSFDEEARDEFQKREDVMINGKSISLYRDQENYVSNATKVHNMSRSGGDNLFGVSPFIIDTVIGQNWDIEFTHMFKKRDDPPSKGSHVYKVGFQLRCTNVMTRQVKETTFWYPGPLRFRKLSIKIDATNRTNENADTLLSAKRKIVTTMLKALMTLVPELFELMGGLDKSTDPNDWARWKESRQYDFLWGRGPLNALLSPVQAIVGSTGYTFTETSTKT